VKLMTCLSTGAKLTMLSFEADTDQSNIHSTVPFSSSFETDDVSNNSAQSGVINSLSAALDANGVLVGDTSVAEVLTKVVGGEVDSDLSSSSQEANSLSCHNNDVVKLPSFSLEINYHELSTAELCELRPEQVRWLYRDCSGRQKKWLPFIGYDSLRIECKFCETRARLVENSLNQSITADELVIVRGGLHEVDVIKKTCAPIYWTGEGLVCFYVQFTVKWLKCVSCKTVS